MERQSLLDSYEIEREVKGENMQKDKERVQRDRKKEKGNGMGKREIEKEAKGERKTDRVRFTH